MRSTFLVAVPTLVFAADFYASPTAAGSGTGSIASPWTLAEVCANPQPAAITSAVATSAVTVWLRGGTYAGQRNCYLEGNATYSVTLRGYPGESPLLDGYQLGSTLDVLRFNRAYSAVRDLEIFNSGTERYVSVPGSNNLPDGQSGGLNLLASNTSLINSWIHDVANNCLTPQTASTVTIHGSVFSHCGMDAVDRQHGHCIYTQNNDPANPKLFTANIISNCAQNEIQQYGSGSSELHGFTWDINLFSHSDNTGGFLFGGSSSTTNLLIENSVLAGAATSLYYSNETNEDVTLTGNIFTASASAFWWRTITLSGNVFLGSSISTRTRADADTSLWSGDGDSWTGTNGLWIIAASDGSGSSSKTLAQLQALGWEATGTAGAVYNTPIVRMRENAYEPGRANVYVVNRNSATTTTVDMSNVLNVGDPYQIIDSMCMDCGAVQTGVYAGGNLTLTLNGSEWKAPTGDLTTPRCWNTDCASCDPVPAGCVTHAAYTSSKPADIRGFIVRRRQVYRAATRLSWRGTDGDVITWGYKRASGAYVMDGPSQAGVCAAGVCSAAIPQSIGAAYYSINGGPAMKAVAE